jgi:ubiquinone/menaquinone biosynthesis C-methylase UbiE
MPDLYATIEKIDPKIQEHLANILEMRASDPQQQAMLQSYLSEIEFPENTKVLEIGCGTGAVTRTLAKWHNIAETIGIDPSLVFIEKAKKLSNGIPNIHFEKGDGRFLKFDASSFDVVIMHTIMCHVPEPELLAKEAFRVLKSGGFIAVFDGDYATMTVATGDFDPLEVCIDAFRDGFIHDKWLIRRLPRLIQSKGFEIMPIKSYSYIEAPKGSYLLTCVDRGADVLFQSGRIGKKQAKAFKDEAQRRSEDNEWFGHINFASIIAKKPDR